MLLVLLLMARFASAQTSITLDEKKAKDKTEVGEEEPKLDVSGSKAVEPEQVKTGAFYAPDHPGNKPLEKETKEGEATPHQEKGKQEEEPKTDLPE